MSTNLCERLLLLPSFRLPHFHPAAPKALWDYFCIYSFLLRCRVPLLTYSHRYRMEHFFDRLLQASEFRKYFNCSRRIPVDILHHTHTLCISPCIEHSTSTLCNVFACFGVLLLNIFIYILSTCTEWGGMWSDRVALNTKLTKHIHNFCWNDLQPPFQKFLHPTQRQQLRQKKNRLLLFCTCVIRRKTITKNKISEHKCERFFSLALLWLMTMLLLLLHQRVFSFAQIYSLLFWFYIFFFEEKWM